MPTPFSPVHLHPDGLHILDQTRLPAEERWLVLATVEDVAEAIRVLRVRGAPLIGIAAAYGVALAARGSQPIEPAIHVLGATRPTAVNLRWALDRMQRRALAASGAGEDVAAALETEARAIHDEDRRMCDAIGDAGLSLVPDGAVVMTHCNAGRLATGGIGTALAPVYRAHAAGRKVHVISCETRPLLQGARLTTWELTRSGVPCTLITDSMAASRLAQADVTCVLVGADRIAANGDAANKIGTYALALAAHAHGVPFYVAAPRSTFDAAVPDGESIPIEERAAEEITHTRGAPLATPGVPVWNPAFDVTPAALIAGYVTDAGMLRAAELSLLAEPTAIGPA